MGFVPKPFFLLIGFLRGIFMRSSVLVVAATIFFSGCVTTAGTKFEMAIVDSFQTQVTTKDDAVAKLGKPTSLMNQSDGGTILVWSYAEGNLGRVASAGVSILFNKDGKMVRVVSRSENTVR